MSNENLGTIREAAKRAVLRADWADFENGENGFGWLDVTDLRMNASIARVENGRHIVAVTMIVPERFAVHYAVTMNGESWEGVKETGRVYA